MVTHFQPRHSNDCWQLDLSPSDLKDLLTWPDWINPQRLTRSGGWHESEDTSHGR